MTCGWRVNQRLLAFMSSELAVASILYRFVAGDHRVLGLQQ